MRKFRGTCKSQPKTLEGCEKTSDGNWEKVIVVDEYGCNRSKWRCGYCNKTFSKKAVLVFHRIQVERMRPMVAAIPIQKPGPRGMDDKEDEEEDKEHDDEEENEEEKEKESNARTLSILCDKLGPKLGLQQFLALVDSGEASKKPIQLSSEVQEVVMANRKEKKEPATLRKSGRIVSQRAISTIPTSMETAEGLVSCPTCNGDIIRTRENSILHCLACKHVFLAEDWGIQRLRHGSVPAFNWAAAASRQASVSSTFDIMRSDSGFFTSAAGATAAPNAEQALLKMKREGIETEKEIKRKEKEMSKLEKEKQKKEGELRKIGGDLERLRKTLDRLVARREKQLARKGGGKLNAVRSRKRKTVLGENFDAGTSDVEEFASAKHATAS